MKAFGIAVPFPFPAWRGRASGPLFPVAAASVRPRDTALADAQSLGARLPALLVAAERVAAIVAQGVHGRRRSGIGDSFWQYRPALPGEPASRIDWRQSARSSRTYVRETEWEAAQSVCLWPDMSASMRWRSDPALPLKAERAELLLLALGSLLLRGGEQVRIGSGAQVSGQTGLSRLATQLASRPASDSPDLPPGSFELPRHARLVLIGDMLAELPRIEALFARLSAIPVDCTLLQILDPAELSLPYAGRVRFEGMEGEASILLSRAQDVGRAYAAALEEHQRHLGALCARAGFGLIRHRTDQPPHGALLALHGALHQSVNRFAAR